jgi:hypothetical protein
VQLSRMRLLRFHARVNRNMNVKRQMESGEMAGAGFRGRGGR